QSIALRPLVGDPVPMPESLFEKVGARHDPYVTSTPSQTASQECCTPAAQGIGAERVPGAAQGPAQRHALYVPTAVSELEEELVRSLAQVLGVEETSRGSGPEVPSVVTIDEIEPGIVQVTMQDRVHKNMFSAELIAGLIKAFQVIEESVSTKVVILTGYESYFASGGTKESLLAIQEGRLKFTDENIYSLALDCKLPVIAAMQGHAIGAGWSLGLFCDFVVMSRDSSYASNYITYGFTPGAGATLIFPEKLGASIAQEVLYTGKAF